MFDRILEAQGCAVGRQLEQAQIAKHSLELTERSRV